MKNFLLSIIIPCYNSGRFLVQTVEMLLRQDLTNCELLLVNDGSTDNTLEICSHYATLYENIRVINQPNHGVSVARNAGITAAQGCYLYFLDSDDMLTDGSLDFFRNILSRHPKAQMLAFGYKAQNYHTEKVYVSPQFSGELFGEQAIRAFLDKQFVVHIGSVIYRRSFIIDNGIHFIEGIHIGEDIAFFIQSMLKINIAFYSPKIVFIYQVRNDSVMKGYRTFEMVNFSHLYAVQGICDNYPRLEKSYNLFISIIYLSLLIRYIRYGQPQKEIDNRFLELAPILNNPIKGWSRYHCLVYLFRRLSIKTMLTVKSRLS